MKGNSRGLGCGFGQVGPDVVEVVVGGELDQGQVFFGGRAEDLAGNAGDQGVGRDHGALGDHGSGGDDGIGSDAGSVQDRGADADEDVVLDGAAVDGGVVADADSVADQDRVEVAHAVEDGAVLNVGAGADADTVGVATDDGVHPEGGLRAEVDVADELGGGVDVAAVGEGGGNAAVGADHGLSIGVQRGRVLRGWRELRVVGGSGWGRVVGRGLGQVGRMNSLKWNDFLGAKTASTGYADEIADLAGLEVYFILAEVRVQEGEPLENALRRFKRKVQTEDIIKEVKRHSFYLKPGEKKRVKEALARKRNRKKVRKEQD